MGSVSRLNHEEVEAIARRVVELLGEQPATQSVDWVDARRIAEEFGVSRDFVYSHADELGAVPLGARGDGRRPRLRFNLPTVAAALATQNRRRATDMPDSPRAASRKRRRTTGASVQLLPIRGRSEAA